MTRWAGAVELLVEDAGAFDDENGREWDKCVAAAGAPFFYRSWWLSAYLRNPTQHFDSAYHLMARRRSDGSVAGVCPAYVQADPLGVLGATTSRALISHCWQSYHTTVPLWCQSSSERAAVLGALVEALERRAAEQGLPRYGFVNVPADAEAAGLLADWFGAGRVIDSLHRLDLTGLSGLNDYLATLTGRVRGQIRRHLRRSAEAGVRVETADPAGELTTVAAELMVSTAKRAGGNDFLRLDRLTGFLRQTSGPTTLLVARDDDRVLGVGAVVIEGTTLHTTSAGMVREPMPFSVHLLMLVAAVRMALASGCDLLVGGRRNTEVKRRFGMRPMPLLAFTRTAGI
jgi:predicted N-acyltransferase